MSKKRIAVIFGGASSEHEVSRLSSAYIINSIDKEKFDVVTIGITKDGRWFLTNAPTDKIANGEWENDTNNKKAFISPAPTVGGLVVLNSDGHSEVIKLDVVFPVLHGKNGEDGTVQGLLELSKIPYVGCGVAASACCMDKVFTNIMLRDSGIDEADFTWFYTYEYKRSPEKCIEQVENALAYPIFVKPANAGSSVGVNKAKNREQLINAIEIAIKEDSKILFEENIIGKEVECAVFGNEDIFASIPGEIAPAKEFYDYEAKYQSASSELYIPAKISDELIEKVRETAKKAYHLFGCAGLTRVDFFVTEDGRVLLNELNTLPGFTSISMYPKLMANCGKEGKQLIAELIDLALNKNMD